ncbi:transposase [Candidatus Poribacteria bacterium]|nr:transposase [Candidatus Poribacteria bacterium]
MGQWTATTKPCSDCGFHNETLTLSDRQWTCPECGSHHDRDINAAINDMPVEYYRETPAGGATVRRWTL